MAADAEPELVRHRVEVDADEAEIVLAALLDAFPGGVEEADAPPGRAAFAGYLPVGAAPALPAGLVAAAEPVAPGWRDGWRAFHRPVRLGRFWVGPPWLVPDEDAEPIVIEPGQAFGTGAHGSTRAAARLLLALAPGGPVLDVGCGSGVLAIIAARLGYGPVAALDLDPLAVEATRENASGNGATVEVGRADALADALPAGYPLWIANLELRLLEPLFLRDDLPPRIIVSGLLVAERFDPPGYRAAAREEADGWQALLLEREAA